MRVFLGILTLLSAFLLASLASASQLDFQPGDIAGAPTYKIFNGNKTDYESSSGPIRHRRPYRTREREDYGYHAQPEYWAMLGAGAFDPTDQPGNGLYLNGGVGATMAQQVDLGVQVSWYHHSTNGEEFVREGDLPDGTHVRTVITTQDINTDLVPVMGTVRVRIPTSPNFEPYVGGGIGWEFLTVSGTDSSGFSFQNDYDGFGAQLFAGANLNVSSSTGLYGEAVWNASTPKAEFFDPSVGQVVREEADFDGLAFHGGLRFMF
jgi:opacity protein-like surface antigen